MVLKLPKSDCMARVLIGTSGRTYASWRGPFFPDGLRIKDQLRYYGKQFNTAELNGVFYRTPTCETVTNWREQTGKDFVFAWKASRFITHWKRLKHGDKRIGFRSLGPAIHQQVLAVGVFAIDTLNRYCIAAASSPLAPPNCSSSMFPNAGSGSSTRTVYISFLT
jgi:hypothetical protein